ncbi:MAG: nucleoside-diphosphate kinase [Candidatus Diapherotrites archaeon]|uniref:Nucleoside diphosphate kinase n=1 Tax=Candidatus Iainarchaeum sp. TaxID=3101447 RepID=A0A2D6LP83_9ARCH|nr:nucleoside-diphosphate kinase [Candidatus Diapherotrites archaeon]
MERTLVIIKPDAINRGLVGEVIDRFERKGIKLVAMKMKHLDDKILEEHYSHLVDKPFFAGIKEFMQRAPSILIVLEGRKVVDVVRKLAGVTEGTEAMPGTIRGDFSLSVQNTIIHASDSQESAKKEVTRFFTEQEILDWDKIDMEVIYSDTEKE